MFFFVAQKAFAGVIQEPPNNLGLVGYWSFEDVDGTGSVATDFSGNGNSGTLTNDTVDVDGKYGKGVTLDGTNDYIDMGDQASLEVEGSIPFSISAWFKVTTSPSTNTSVALVTKGTPSTRGYALQYENISDTYYVNISKYGVVDQRVTVSELNTDTWYQIVGVQESTEIEYYLNGVSQGTYSNASAYIASGADTFRIGTTGSGTLDFDGSVDEVRVYSRSLSAVEVSNLYDSGFSRFNTSPRNQLTNGLVGYWTFDGKDGLTDISGNGNDGTEYNDATVTIGKFGQGYYFDGSGDSIQIATPSGLYSSEATWTGWFKRDADALHYLFGMGLSTDRFLVYTASNQRIGFHDDINNDSQSTNSSNFVFEDGAWNHVAVLIKSDGTKEAYVNGVSSLSDADGSNLTEISSGDFWIGSQLSGSGGFLGSMDNVRVYNRVLSSDEINELYNAGRSTINKSTDNKTASESLIGHWTFDGPDGLTDVAGSGNDGTANGDAEPAIGRIGQGYTFDGTGDYISLGNYFDGKIETKTVSFWANPPSTPSGTQIVFGMGNTHYYVGVTSLDRMIASHRNASNVQKASYSSNGFLEPGEWHHYTVVWDVSGSDVDVSFYKDGVFDETDSYSDGYYDTYGASALMGSYSGSGNYYSGELDDVRVYNKALSASEILQLYNETR